ncbi:MAG: glycosyltransferase family 4 protein [Cellulophaga sp.]
MRIIMYQPEPRAGLALYSHLLNLALNKKSVNTAMVTTTKYQFASRSLNNYEVIPLLKSYLTKNNNKFLKKMLLIYLHIYNIWKFTFFIIFNSYYKTNNIIHYQLINYFTDLPFLIFQKVFTNKCFILTVHDVFPHKYFFNKKIENIFIKIKYFLFDHLIIHSEENKKQILEIYGADSNKISIIPHGPYGPSEENLICQKKINSFKKRFEFCKENQLYGLFFGRIRENKGLDVLLKSIALIKKDLEKRFTLIIAGLGEISSYNKLIESLKIRKYVKIISKFISYEDVEILFNICDFVLLPYKTFGSQSGVLELALGYNKPIIVSDVGSLGEIVKKRKAGLIVKPNSPIDLSLSIRKFIEDKIILTNFSRSIKLTSNLTWEDIAILTKKVYQKFSQL